MAELPEILETLILGPEDRLVVVLPAGTSADVIQHAREVVDGLRLGSRVLFVAGIEQLAVLRGTDGAAHD